MRQPGGCAISHGRFCRRRSKSMQTSLLGLADRRSVAHLQLQLAFVHGIILVPITLFLGQGVRSQGSSRACGRRDRRRPPVRR